MGLLPDVSHGLMTVSRQFGKSVRVHHVVAWVPDGAQSVNILLLPFCMWFTTGGAEIATWFPPPPGVQDPVLLRSIGLQSLGNVHDFFPEFLFSATVHLFLICARIQTIRKFGFCAVAISAPPVVT